MRNCRGNIFLELLAGIGLVAVLAGGMGGLTRLNAKANEAEVKSNLCNIQLSVERFAVDSEGAYPPYLIGGEVRWAAEVDPQAEQPFRQINEAQSRTIVSDPLLRAGYVTAYPRNPFIKHGLAVHALQANLVSAVGGCDPLRNGPDTAAQGFGTRFGAECNVMGNVYADPRFPTFFAPDAAAGHDVEFDTWATVEYDMWDLWLGEEPLPFLPGMFFYKSAGLVPAQAHRALEDGVHPSATKPQQPYEIDMYILGAFGGPRTKGKDVVGDERPLVYRQPGEAGLADQEYQVWTWTRSVVSQDLTKLGGCPFSPPLDTSDRNYGNELQYGNPNGIRDALILVLTAGEDYIGDYPR